MFAITRMRVAGLLLVWMGIQPWSIIHAAGTWSRV